VLSEPRERGIRNGTTRQGVLEDAEVDSRTARFGAQLSDLSDLQTAILGKHDRLGLRNLPADLGDERLFLFQIKTQGLPP